MSGRLVHLNQKSQMSCSSRLFELTRREIWNPPITLAWTSQARLMECEVLCAVVEAMMNGFDRFGLSEDVLTFVHDPKGGGV
jgi:hypothetical protein